jgi:hypothetical protein
MPKLLRSGPDDDLGLPWNRLGDGRVWRLQRGRDYEVETDALARAAEVAGARMGKVPSLLPDRVPRLKYWDDYAWIQFVDHDVLVGSPCPCGSDELVRTHPKYARCPACGAHLKLSTPKPQEQFADEAPVPSRPGPVGESEAKRAKALERGSYRSRWDERFALEEYSDVVSFARYYKPRRERLYGFAVDPLGLPVLIWVLYPLDEGARRPHPEDPSVEFSRIHRWPIPPFGLVIDLGQMPSPSATGEVPERSFELPHEIDDHRATGRLHKFSRVKLVHQEDLPGRERFYGHAVDQDGAASLIYVDYPLIGGARVPDPDDDVGEVHFAYRWPIEPFGPVVDLSSLSS